MQIKRLLIKFTKLKQICKLILSNILSEKISREHSFRFQLIARRKHVGIKRILHFNLRLGNSIFGNVFFSISVFQNDKRDCISYFSSFSPSLLEWNRN